MRTGECMCIVSDDRQRYRFLRRLHFFDLILIQKSNKFILHDFLFQWSLASNTSHIIQTVKYPNSSDKLFPRHRFDPAVLRHCLFPAFLIPPCSQFIKWVILINKIQKLSHFFLLYEYFVKMREDKIRISAKWQFGIMPPPPYTGTFPP